MNDKLQMFKDLNIYHLLFTCLPAGRFVDLSFVICNSNEIVMENVVIIGGGPAGLSAAIYLARAGLNPLVFAGSPPGGQLTLTSDVENFPGYEKVLGAQLVEKMRKQAEKFGARIMDKNVVKVDFFKKPFEIYLSDFGSIPKFFDASGAPYPKSAKNLVSSPILVKSVIVATGAKALWLGLESEKRLLGKGVSACATCDGFFFKGKTVAVIGGGDTALEEALTLTKFANKVYIIHRREEFRASKVMQERVKNNPKIEIIFNAAVEEILGEKKVEGIKIRNVGVGRDRPVQKELDGVFVAIGHKPDTELFKNQIERDEKGYIITTNRLANEMFKSQILNHPSERLRAGKSQINNKSQIKNPKRLEFGISNLFGTWNLEFGIYQSSTSIPGVFAAGDCVDHVYRQAATAAGMGVATALETEKYLETIK